MSNKHYVKRLKRLARKAGMGRHGSVGVLINDLNMAKKAQARAHQRSNRSQDKAAVDLLAKLEKQDKARGTRGVK